ncbi:NAD-dependent epimerase/dehydratase family protein [Roseibium sp.]|uniref:NAD-dependent epimerase/dehydratase family protein n=1 Tax=Roseibium sp. TaxID=1936156 RepID=UPI003D0C7055
MHFLITGASGTLGRFIASRLSNDGHELTLMGRTPPAQAGTGFQEWDLSDTSVSLPVADALVHCAFSHVPGKYRGGEGDDPHGFIARNAEGTVRLFEAAKSAGIRHCVFLSSRAVYSDTGNWAVLTENAETRPDTLYGQVKLVCEQALESLCDDGFCGTSLRATGIYGCPPGQSVHKWSDLFEAFVEGRKIAPRLGTEVHGDDLADAVALVLEKRPGEGTDYEVYNVSDLLLDRQDLLKLYAGVKGMTANLPGRGAGPVGVMEPGKLKVLGWAPGGMTRLKAFLETLS